MQPPSHHVAMMQIDCEVMNTKLLHVKEDAIPVHLSAHMTKPDNPKQNANSTSAGIASRAKPLKKLFPQMRDSVFPKVAQPTG